MVLSTFCCWVLIKRQGVQFSLLWGLAVYFAIVPTCGSCAKVEESTPQVAERASIFAASVEEPSSGNTHLFEENGRLKADGDGNTRLHLAAKENQIEEIKAYFPDKNVSSREYYRQNLKGQTPLHFAVEGGHFQLCKILLEKLKEVSRDSKDSVDNEDENAWLPRVFIREHGTEFTPLDLAASKGYVNIVQFFLDELKIPPDEDPASRKFYIEQMDNFLFRTLTRVSPLSISVNQGKGEAAFFVAKKFVELGFLRELFRSEVYADGSIIRFAIKNGEVKLFEYMLELIEKNGPKRINFRQELVGVKTDVIPTRLKLPSEVADSKTQENSDLKYTPVGLVVKYADLNMLKKLINIIKLINPEYSVIQDAAGGELGGIIGIACKRGRIDLLSFLWGEASTPEKMAWWATLNVENEQTTTRKIKEAEVSPLDELFEAMIAAGSWETFEFLWTDLQNQNSAVLLSHRLNWLQYARKILESAAKTSKIQNYQIIISFMQSK